MLKLSGYSCYWFIAMIPDTRFRPSSISFTIRPELVSVSHPKAVYCPFVQAARSDDQISRPDNGFLASPLGLAAAFRPETIGAAFADSRIAEREGTMTQSSATQLGSEQAADKTTIRPFQVNVPEAELTELRRRINSTRWPDRETVTDESQGVPLATIQELARYWGTDYDWRKCEAKLNALPQLITEIDGLDIHFIHVRSKHENALPLIVTHGWPGSVIEQLKIIDPLTNPTAHGGSASDAFHLVIPSLPGFGFSARPTTSGWGPDRTASAWVVLMKRLGYAQFVAQGGDLGASVCTVMAKHAPPELLGIHTNFPGTIPSDIARALQCGDPPPSGLSAGERRAYEQLTNLYTKKRSYAQMMATRPQTLYGLADSPVCLAAWLFDHGDGYGQPAAPITLAVLGRTVNGYSAGDLTTRRCTRRLHTLLVDEHGDFCGSFLLGKSPQSL
jgi:pimeloyl-ACP methyl ester carboxylesterase